MLAGRAAYTGQRLVPERARVLGTVQGPCQGHRPSAALDGSCALWLSAVTVLPSILGVQAPARRSLPLGYAGYRSSVPIQLNQNILAAGLAAGTGSLTGRMTSWVACSGPQAAIVPAASMIEASEKLHIALTYGI